MQRHWQNQKERGDVEIIFNAFATLFERKKSCLSRVKALWTSRELGSVGPLDRLG